ncbi:Protein transport protein [Trichinella spiralis]|uniref:Protein transport protein n=1 Tax=Trichinella spiralis TaxID=6334 RepID=A0ABR3L175_TRISP
MELATEMDVQRGEGVRRVTLHDATLTVSNDESPYFQSSPLPLPVAVPEACRLARIPAMGSQARFFFSPTAPAPPPALLPVNGDFPLRSLLVPCWPETGFKEMTLSICVRQLCKFAIDVVLRLCFGANLVVIVTPPRGTVSVAMRLCYCLAGSDTWPMIDIRFAVTPLISSFGVAPFISLGIKHLKLISIESFPL